MRGTASEPGDSRFWWALGVTLQLPPHAAVAQKNHYSDQTRHRSARLIVWLVPSGRVATTRQSIDRNS
jgi:hypothetical protein